MSGRLRGVRAQELVRALEKVGFEFVRQKGSQCTMHEPISDILVTVPMHSGELPRWLVKKIIKEAGMTEEAFRKFL